LDSTGPHEAWVIAGELRPRANPDHGNTVVWETLPFRALALITAILLSIAVAALLYTLHASPENITVEVFESGSSLKFTVMCGSRVSISFNNSVTGSPVTLVFEVCSEGFKGVGIVTDSAALEYYSSGVIDVNSSIKSFKSKTLEFCTTGRVKISIGDVEVDFSNTCLSIIVKSYRDSSILAKALRAQHLLESR